MTSELRVLVVDDEPSMRGMLSQLLREEGHETADAASGDEALAEFYRRPYPLVITDIRMPGKNGIELLEEIKRTHPNTLVIIITSHASVDTAVAALRAGAYDYLIKPFEAIDLILNVVNRAAEQIELTAKNRVLVEKLRQSNQELERLNQTFRELAIRDGLTGLYNHRRFQEMLSLEVERARRYQRFFSLIFFDVDYFKQYNDALGHIEGDRLLQALAQVITGRLRRADLAARYGGEEFVILLPETTAEQARQLAEEIRLTVAGHPFAGRGKLPQGKISVSIGVATFPEDGADGPSLVVSADRRQYQAKKSGRNRVCWA